MESTGGHQGTWFRASPAMGSFQNVHVLMVKLKTDSKINPALFICFSISLRKTVYKVEYTFFALQYIQK
jgi:hypothetical protein